MKDGLGRLGEYPRVVLSHLPTPIEELPNLGRDLGGPGIFIKRDDCTGLAMGGNKSRHLEFYLGEAGRRGADTVLITGAVQSNYVRMAAAAARRLGMDCHIQLEERVPGVDTLYRTSGNVLLDRVLGATLHSYPAGEDEEGADNRLDGIAEELRRGGAKPYAIRLGPSHRPLGALGYVIAAGEILEQLRASGLGIDEVVVASGSGATHMGLLFGLRALGSAIAVTGICVRREAEKQRPRLIETAAALARMLGMEPVVEPDDIRLVDDLLAPGYGRTNDRTLEAIRMMAHCEGILLDPVYTGKAAAGMIRLIRQRTLEGTAKVLFIHTGGTPALFGYGGALVDGMAGGSTGNT